MFITESWVSSLWRRCERGADASHPRSAPCLRNHDRRHADYQDYSRSSEVRLFPVASRGSLIVSPRPDMLDRCQPMAGAADAAVYGLSTVAICTVQTGHIILDGFRSFPSGHASCESR